MSLTAVLIVHILVLWLIFYFVLAKVIVPWPIWLPVAMVETVPLYIIIGGMERKLRSRWQSP
jgi:hypothetical protein